MNPVVIIPIVISFIMMIIAFITLGLSIKRDDKNEREQVVKNNREITESLLKANMKLDQLCTTTQETRSDLKNIETRVSSIEGRVLALERRDLND